LQRSEQPINWCALNIVTAATLMEAQSPVCFDERWTGLRASVEHMSANSLLEEVFLAD
jgi:hypothetical protein